MKDIKEASFSTVVVKDLEKDGIIDRIKPGLYRIANLEYPDEVSLGFVDAARAIPTGVICLISALSHYELTTFNPSKIFIAVGNQTYAPKIIYPPVEIFYFRHRFHKPGIEVIKTKYGDVKIYSREKTVCDMFRYRNKFGEDIALEGLKNYVGYKYANLEKLREFAEICRVKRVMMPYLKAMVN